MKKKILGMLLVLALLISSAISVSAAEPGYGLWVGGVEVNASNAADVLGDGSVSYDAATKTLTLNGANITTLHTTDMVVAGIYSEIADLTVKLAGENRITLPISDDDMPDGSEIAVFSSKNIEISGTGKLWSNSYVVGSAHNVLIKDCEISSEWICASAMGKVTADNATLSGKVGLINTGSGDITLKNTAVPEGGNYIGIYTEMGNLTIENCNITIHGAVVDDDAIVPIAIGEGAGTLTVKNSVLDLKGNMYGILAPSSKGVFENVSGKIELMGDAAYATMFGGVVSMKSCDLEIVCRATNDAACGIFSTNDINVEDSKLKIDARTVDEAAVCIGGLESPNTNVNILNSTLELRASGPNAVGFYANNVKLNQSITDIEAIASANGKGFAAGIVAAEGRAVVNGGALGVLATGPVEHEGPGTVGILMGNPSLVPEFIDADIKLRGNQAICAYPDLTQYKREHEIFASPDLSGESVGEFKKDDPESIRFLHIYPLYQIKFDANGGTGEMFENGGRYGEYTLPENAFEAPEGKKFKGWSTSKDGEILAEGAAITLRDDVTFYPIWEDIEKAPVTPEDPVTPGDPNHPHVFGSEWKYTDEEHYQECECGQRQHVSAHADSNGNGSCDVCGARIGEPEEEGGLGTGAIVGIVIGAVVVVGIGGFSIFWFVIKKKSFSDLFKKN